MANGQFGMKILLPQPEKLNTILRAYHEGNERAICTEPGTRFRWRITGR
jgi:hypothetical protein